MLTDRDKKIRKIQILREKTRRKVVKSFAFFVLQYCWIEDKISNTAIKFDLWPAQLRILPVFLTAPLLIILKARQLGLTWLTAAYCLWIVATKPMQLVVVVSAKEDWAVEFLDRVKFMFDRLPDWLKPQIKKDTSLHLKLAHQTYKPDGRPNKHLKYSEIKSLPTTLEGAQGKTPDLLVMDESARNRYAKQIFASSLPGIEKAGGRIIVISNSHKDGTGWGWTRNIFLNSMQGLNSFARIFMPWWDCPERLTDAEVSSMAKDKEYIPADFKAKQIESGMDNDDFSQNYPETEAEAVSSLLGSYFGKTLARFQNRYIPGVTGNLIVNKSGEIEFLRTDDKKLGIMEVWRWPYMFNEKWNKLYWQRRYAIGSDVSEGLGQSYSVAYVIDRLSDEMVCRVRSNRLDASEWALVLFNLSRYYDNAMICPEKTGAGQTTVKRLQELDGNLYRKVVAGKVGSGMTKDLGFNQSNQAKHDLSEDLKNWFRHTKGGFWCPVLLDEAGTWTLKENNKIGPEDGKFGDCVIAAGLTIECSEVLGASPKQIPAEVTGWRKTITRGEKTGWTG